MHGIEPLDDPLFTPPSTPQATQTSGDLILPPAPPTYERYADYGPNGEFLGWGLVQVD